jgi:hypothetical protein
MILNLIYCLIIYTLFGTELRPLSFYDFGVRDFFKYIRILKLYGVLKDEQ